LGRPKWRVLRQGDLSTIGVKILCKRAWKFQECSRMLENAGLRARGGNRWSSAVS
jgi:hypothetical protein